MTFRTGLTVKRALLATACLGVLLLGAASAPVSASRERARALHVIKECGQFQGNPGEWCTIRRSNLRQIPAGSQVFYTQPAGIPAGLLDSNVVLDAGNGNRALGRCTVDMATRRGLCTFSDGTGRLAGFEARADVSYVSGNDWRWDGAASFDDDVD
jgi:hypothetical protein